MLMCANEAKHIKKDLLYQSGYRRRGYHVQGMRLSCQCMAIQCRFLTRGYAKHRNGFLLGLRYANVSLAHSGVESS